MNFPTTPLLLAAHLDHADGGKKVRAELRKLSPETAPGRGGRWEVNADLANAILRRFGSSRS